jgi:two-component system response regulator RegA
MTETLDDRTPKPSILLVDDDERFRSRMARAFEERGYEAQHAEGYDGAIEIAEHESTEYAVVDLRMPGKSGLEVVRELHRIDPATKIVVLTGYGSIATALEAVRLGATHYLTKPADVDEVIASRLRLPKAGPPKPRPWPESSGSTSNES